MVSDAFSGGFFFAFSFYMLPLGQVGGNCREAKAHYDSFFNMHRDVSLFRRSHEYRREILKNKHLNNALKPHSCHGLLNDHKFPTFTMDSMLWHLKIAVKATTGILLQSVYRVS
jgi:hypothetical protein